jgi:hypothetical protein
LVSGDPPYATIERALALTRSITVPAVTLDGEADGNFPDLSGGGLLVQEAVHRIASYRRTEAAV